MPLATELTSHILTSRQTTAGAAEETALLELDGAAPAASIAVPEGTKMEISDVEVCIISTIVQLCIQESRDNGATWFNHFCVRFDTAINNSQSMHYPFRAPIVIVGAANKLLRARIMTPNGPLLVTVTIRMASQP